MRTEDSYTHIMRKYQYVERVFIVIRARELMRFSIFSDCAMQKTNTHVSREAK